MAVLKLSKNDVTINNDNKVKLKRDQLSYDSTMVSNWETTNKSAIEIINNYSKKLQNNEYLSADDIASYRKAVEDYVSSSNRLRGLNKIFGKGYTDEEEKAWTDNLTNLQSSPDSISSYYSQFDSEDAFNSYKDYLHYGDVYNQYLTEYNPEVGMAGFDQYHADRKEEISQNVTNAKDFNGDGKVEWWEDALYAAAMAGTTPDTNLPTAGLTQAVNDLRLYGQDIDTSTWTDEQKAIFGSVYTTDKAEALKLADYINKTNKDAKIKEISESATLGDTGLAVLESLTGGIDYLQDLVEANATGGISVKGSVTPFEHSQAIIGGNTQKLNDKYGTLDEDLIVIGGKGWGDLYGVGTSILQSAAAGTIGGGWGSLIMLGGSAAASGMDDVLARGGSVGQAILYGGAVGLAEGIAEKIGMDTLVDLLFKKGSTSLLKAIAKQFLAEGAEEGLTSFANGFIDNLVMGDKSNFNALVQEYVSEGMSESEAKTKAWLQYLEDIAYDMAAGALSGAVHAGVGGAISMPINSIKNNSEYNATAKSIYGESSSELIAEGLEMPQDSEAYKLAETYSKITNEGKSLSGSQIRKLVKAIDAKKSVFEEGTQSDTSVNDELLQLANEVSGVKSDSMLPLSTTEMEKRAAAVMDDFNAANSTVRSRLEAGQANLFQAGEYSPKTETTPTKAYKVSSEGVTTRISDGEEIKILGINAIKDRKVYLRIDDDDEEIDAEDVSFATKEEGLLYEMVADLGVSVNTANSMIDIFGKGNTSIESYRTDAPLAYQYGTINYVKGLANLNLTQDQKTTLFGLGRTDAGLNAKARVEANKNRFVPKTKKNGITYEGFDVTKEKLKPIQKASLNAAEFISKVSNLDVHVYKSFKENGKIYAIIDGVKQEADNGYFISGTNKIYLDINAGNAMEGVMLYTMSHEVGHYIRDWNAEEFKALGDFIFEHYNDTGYPVNTLINRAINKLKEQYKAEDKPLPSQMKLYDEAYEEVVCDALSKMFADPNAYTVLAELKQENKTLWQKLGEAIKKFLDKVKDILSVYKNRTPDSPSASLVEGFDRKTFEQLQEMYIKAFVQADENFASASIKNANEMVFGQAEVSEGTQDFSVKKQLRENSKIGQKAINYNNKHNNVNAAILKAGVDTMMDMAEVMIPFLDEEGILPPDIAGKTIFKNGSYGRSGENTTLCVRTLTYEDFKDRVADELGRPLTVSESLLVSQKIYDIAVDPQCIYCYVAADRKAYDEYLGEYWKAMDKYIKALRKGGDSEALYKEYLDGRKDTAQQQKRWAMWKKIAQSGKSYISAKDLSTRKNRDAVIANGGNLATQVRDAQRYAQSASWAKTVYDYRAYKGDILKLTQSLVDTLNSEYGLRMYSFSDYTPAFIVENMQMIIDAAVRGLKSLAYTKDTAYAKIFAPTGQAINVSCFAKYDSKTGQFIEDNRQGASWAETQQLRKEYKNVGAVMVATTDAMVEWALKQDWIDVVIPYHIVKTGTTIANEYAWRNYTSESADKKGGRNANIYPTEHNNDFETYQQLINERGITPRFDRFYQKALNGEITTDQYMKLVNEVRLPASELSAVVPKFDLAEAKKSFGVNEDGSIIEGGFVDKGGYMGGWYQQGVDVNQEVLAVSQDIVEGKTSLDVDYGMNKNIKLKQLEKHNIKKSARDSYEEILPDFTDVLSLDAWLDTLSLKELNELVGDILDDISTVETIKNLPTKQERRDAFVNKLYKQGNLNKIVTKLVKSKPQMAKYFANTKMNNKYNPLIPSNGDEYVVMFHGTPNDFYTFDTKRIGKNGTVMGSGIYFTSSLSYAESYKEYDDGKIIATLLNIEKPLSRNKLTITKEQLKTFIKKVVDSTGEDFLSNYGDVNSIGYNKVLDKATNMLFEYNTNDADLIEDIYVTSRMDFDDFHNGLTELLGYDGIIAWNKAEGTQAVVFRSNQVKDIFNFNPTTNPDIRYSKRDLAPTFYSQMGKVVEEMKQDKFAANSVVSMLRGRGVKAEEIRWSGIVTWLEGKKSVTKQELLDFIASSQLQIGEQMKEGGSEVTLKRSSYGDDSWDIMKGGEIVDTYSWNEDSELYESDVTGGGFSTKDRLLEYFKEKYGSGDTRWGKYKLDGGENYRELVFTMPDSSYSNRAMRGHWGEEAEGVLVHARIQDFVVDGKKMLFIEEIQSDWHNEGHKIGYGVEATKDNTSVFLDGNNYYLSTDFDKRAANLNKFYVERVGLTEDQIHEDLLKIYNEKNSPVPDAPFKDTYHEFVLKRLLRMAAEEGYDSIGWTIADTQSKRWSYDYEKAYQIEYDQDMPKFLSKYGRQWGAKVEKSSIETGEDVTYTTQDGVKYSKIRDWFDAQEEALILVYGEYIKDRLTVVEEGKTLKLKDKKTGHVYDWLNVNEGGTEIWSMELTDSMKDSVLHEGQRLFSKRDFGEQVDEVLNGTFSRGNDVYFGETPKILQDVGYNGVLPMLTAARHIRKAALPKNTKLHNHGLTKGQIKSLPDKVASPVMIMDSLDETKNSVVVVTDMFDTEGSPIIVSVKADGKGMQNSVEIDTNYVTGYYGRDGFARFIENNVQADTFLYIDKKKAITLSAESNTSWFEQLKNYDFNVIIRKAKAFVNTNVENSDKKSSKRDTDSISNRSLLANALETAAQNDIEKNKLAQYKSKIELINSEEQKLQDINKELHELWFSKGKRDEKRINELRFEQKQTENRINTYDRQLLTLEASKPLKDVIDREKKLAYKKAQKEGKEALSAYREKSAQTTRELMNRWQESKKKATENRHKTEMRHKIKDVVSKLNQLLLRPTKDKHIKEDLQKAVAEALFIINMDTVGAEERVAKYNELIAKTNDPDMIDELTLTRNRIQLQGETLKDKLDTLRTAYEKIKNSQDAEMVNAYQEVILNSIDNVSEIAGNTPIRYMTYEQLEAVYEMYSMILHAVRTANKMFKAKKGETITQTAEKVNAEVRKFDKGKFASVKGSKDVRSVKWSLLKPLIAFRTIGSETFTDMYNEIRNGEDLYYNDIREAKSYIQDQYKQHNYNAWDTKQTWTFKDKMGDEFTLNLEQIMSLYAYSRREQALAHIMEGGIVLKDNVIVKKNKLGIPIKQEVDTTKSFSLSEGILKEICDTLTKEQKAYVENMQSYLSNEMGAKGNEVSMELLGIKLFKEEYYFPLKSSQDYMDFKPQEAGEIKLKNSSFSKATVQHANNPVVLNNFTDVWAEHVHDMSMYHSFVLPLEDFTRVFNYKTKTNALLKPMSTKQTLSDAHGDGAITYIRNFLTSLNGGVRVQNVGVVSKFMSLFKKGAVMASASVAIQQPSAIMRAMAYINPIYFVSSTHKSINLFNHKKVWAELKQYAPIAGIKEMGRFDVGMGQDTVAWIKDQKTFREKADDVLSKAPAYMDEVTWVSIWEAVKKEVAAKNKDLKVNSEEFLKKCGERFTEVVSLSQVYDSVFSRSDIMRNKNDLAKMLTAFMAEPTTTLNMVWDALVQGKRSGSVKSFLKVTAGTGGAVIASIVFNSVLKSIITAMRDDDDDETYLEKYVEAFVGNTKDNMNPFTYIPFVKDIVSIFEGYDVERMDMALFSDLYQALENMDSENKTEYEKWTGLIGAISAFAGVPFKNVERDIRGAYNTIKSFIEGQQTTVGGVVNAISEGLSGKDSSKTQKLYNAYISGDKEYIKRIEGQFESKSDIDSALRKALRDNDSRIRKAAQAAIDGDQTERIRITKEIVAEGHFTSSIVVGAINAEITALKKKK